MKAKVTSAFKYNDGPLLSEGAVIEGKEAEVAVRAGLAQKIGDDGPESAQSPKKPRKPRSAKKKRRDVPAGPRYAAGNDCDLAGRSEDAVPGGFQ